MKIDTHTSLICRVVVFLTCLGESVPSMVPGNWSQLTRTEFTRSPEHIWLGEPYEFKCQGFPSNVFILTGRISITRPGQTNQFLNNYVGIRPDEINTRHNWANRTVVHVENNNTMYARIPSARLSDEVRIYFCELRDPYNTFKTDQMSFVINVKPYNVSIVYNNASLPATCDQAVDISAETQRMDLYCVVTSKPSATFLWVASDGRTLRANETLCEPGDQSGTHRCVSPVTVDVAQLSLGQTLRVMCFVSCVNTTEEEDREMCVKFKKVHASSAVRLTLTSLLLWLTIGLILGAHTV